MLLNYDVFLCKNLYNIISGPERTVQKKKYTTPLNKCFRPPFELNTRRPVSVTPVSSPRGSAALVTNIFHYFDSIIKCSRIEAVKV